MSTEEADEDSAMDVYLPPLGSPTARGPNLAAAAVGERLSGRINALIYSDGDTLEGEGRGQAIYI
jgi:hypothetical protein